MTDTTQEKAKLTLADLVGLIGGYDSVEAYLQRVSTATHGFTILEQLLARALSASQTALDDINNVIDELTEGNISESKAIASIIIILARAALLDKGDGDVQAR